MIKSMTAYSRASKESTFGRWVVEMHSVNRKFLDMHISLPKEILFLDVEIRKWIAEVLQRGQITVRIALQQESGGAASLASLIKLKEAWEKTASALGYDVKETVTLSFLMQQVPFFAADLSKEETAIRASLKEAVMQSLSELMKMKELEAKALVQDMQKRLDSIEECKEKIEKESLGVVEHYRKKLQERLSEIAAPSAESEERILREVVIYAEKVDIAEEITRLNSHIGQFRKLLVSAEKSVGRTLDFLVQEMNREINTLSAKCVGVELTLIIVTMKTELEKIREQLQNIE